MKLPLVYLIAAGTLCSALHSQPAATQPEAPKAESTISGQIFNAATGEPLKKSSVSLYRQDSQQYQPRQKEVDAAGRFTFENLEPGRYNLSASRSGFTTQMYGAKRPGSRGGNPITLMPKQEMKDLRISLTPHGVIVGRVVDEDGDPRVGVGVSAMKSEWQGNKRQMVSSGSAGTNDLGEYRIYGVAPGNYLIQAAPLREMRQTLPEPNFNPKPEEDYVATYYPGTIDSTTAAPLQVRSGIELRGIDIKMVKARVVRVRGNVVSGAGSTQMRAFLMMMPKDRGWGGGLEMRQAMVMDNKGSFEFRGVTTGQYTLMANLSTPDGQLTAVQMVNVTDQPVTGLQVVLRPGVSISGTVTIEGEEGGKATAQGPPMPMSVSFQPADQGSSGFFGGGSAQVRDDGTFTAKNIQPGRYQLSVYGGGDGYLKAAKLGAEDALANPLEIPDGGAAGALELVVSRKCAEVTGSLQDDKEKPRPGALALLIPEDKYRDQMGRFSVGTADQYGVYAIKNVRPGRYRLIALEGAEGTEWMDPDFLKPYEKAAITLNLEEGQKESRQLTVKPRPADDNEKQ